MNRSYPQALIAVASALLLTGGALGLPDRSNQNAGADACRPASGSAKPATFDGSKLLVLSDADMPASAFLDGKLRPGGRQPHNETDTLTVLDLPLRVGTPMDPGPDDGAVASGQTAVQNSVIGPPYGMVVSPDRRYAYVLRTRGTPPPGTTQVNSVFTDFPTEALVSVVDIRDTRNPRVVQTTVVGRLAHTLDLSPDGSLLALNTDQPGRNLVLRQVQPDGRIGAEVLAHGEQSAGAPVRRVGRVQWHPSGEFLSHGIPFDNEIRFHRVVRDNGRVTLQPWGTAKVGKFPDEGTFTPDGRFYLSTDLHWGDDVPGLFVDPPPGTVTAVRFDAERGRHRVTGRAPTDISPEGIVVSPDGRYVVTANLTDSWLPWNDERFVPRGSMNLLELDPSKGTLRTRQHIPVSGILPEGVVFDASGNHVALTSFDRYDPRYRRGVVEVYALDRGRCAGLVPTGVELEMPTGPHSVLLVD